MRSRGSVNENPTIGVLKSTLIEVNSDGWVYTNVFHGFALLKPLSNSFGAARDHESGVSQQSLARLNAPIGLLA